ncbi:2-oxo acid dehydrogenase subunit E2 [Rhizohabitans arisaemae]|uniref:2-oxo acid dehydrogenase subunit E2 n=1 Tax=Rhizohabitans arisaemae TaxID=2720610 RepID=UPI0024B1FC46|nr:2-oxo acid dehydrogenase subunit E2 [Rhizohabitans arisaemae]
MAELMRMPEVFANSTEAVLASWLVEVGVAFDAGDAIATVETEKAVVDVEAERGGCLLRLLVAGGTSVDVGAPIAVVGSPGEDVPDLASLGLDGGALPAEPTESVSGPQEMTTGRTAPEPPRRVFASPLARRLAAEHGLGIEEISGTGPRGRIRRRDVDAAIATRALAAGPPASAPVQGDARDAGDEVGNGVQDHAGDYVDEPHTRVRRVIARRLTESKRQVPHFYLRASCRVDRLLALRADINRHASTRVSVNDLVIKAAARAHILVPEQNVIWTDAALRRFSSVDIAVAIASSRGLVTPVVRSVESLSVAGVAAAVRDLRKRADSGALRQHELEGGTMSVSNLGMFGTEEFAAILNPPQAGILAVGAIRDEPVAQDGTVRVASVMTVTLSADHRAVDGADAARWLSAFVRVIEDPIQLLI